MEQWIHNTTYGLSLSERNKKGKWLLPLLLHSVNQGSLHSCHPPKLMNCGILGEAVVCKHLSNVRLSWGLENLFASVLSGKEPVSQLAIQYPYIRSLTSFMSPSSINLAYFIKIKPSNHYFHLCQFVSVIPLNSIGTVTLRTWPILLGVPLGN